MIQLFNSRSGGIAEDDTIMADGQCAYAHNVDGRTNPEALQLNRKCKTLATIGDLAICDLDGFYRGCEGGQIYNSSGTLLYPGAGKVIEMVSFKGFLLFWYQTGSVIKLAYAGPASGPSWGSVDLNYGSMYTTAVVDFQATGDAVHFVNDSEDFLYFSVGKNLYFISDDTTTTTDTRVEKVNFNMEDNIVGLTRNGSIINIYLANGRIYFWSGRGADYHEGYTEIGARITCASNISSPMFNGNVNFMVCGGAGVFQKKLYVNQGTSAQLIKDSSFIKDGTDILTKGAIDPCSGLNARFTTSDSRMTYFVHTGESNASGIYSLGKKNEYTPNAFTLEYMDDNIDSIGCITTADANFEGMVKFSTDEGGIYKIKSINLEKYDTAPEYETEGVRYTKKIRLGSPQQYKIDSMGYRYNAPTDTTIEIYFAVNGSSDYELLHTLENWYNDYFPESIDIGVVFYEIQFKIVLKTTNDTVTPALYSFGYKFENNARGFGSQD